jgi:hypothetical protein
MEPELCRRGQAKQADSCRRQWSPLRIETRLSNLATAAVTDRIGRGGCVPVLSISQAD